MYLTFFLTVHQNYAGVFFSHFFVREDQDVPYSAIFRAVKRETNCIEINQDGKLVWIQQFANRMLVIV